MSAQWVAWLALSQFSVMGMLIMAMKCARSYMFNLSALCAVVYTGLQGVDELIAGNLFRNSWIEYVLLLSMSALVYIKTLLHERS